MTYLFSFLLGLYLVQHVKTFQRRMNLIGELENIAHINFLAPLVNVVVVAFHRFETQGAKPVNDVNRSCAFTAEPDSEECFQSQNTFELASLNKQLSINPFPFLQYRAF